MHPTFKKLNFAGQDEIHVLGASDSFEAALHDMADLTEIRRTVAPGESLAFALAFCTTQAEVDRFAELCAHQSQGDVVAWVAYPKQSSKRYRCEFNRDSGWQAFGAQGFEPVRQVAIDEDWSALRLRRTEFIGSLKRKKAISDAGRARLEKTEK